MVAAMNRGPFDLTGLAPALDVRSTLRAVGALTSSKSLHKLEVELSDTSTRRFGFQVIGESAGWDAFRGAGTIDVGNSGTTIRLTAGILAGSSTSAVLTGDRSIKRRPMGRVVEPLRAMGATIAFLEGDGCAPFRVDGGPLTGINHELAVASAQVKSALIFAGLRASGSTSITEPGPSRDHTERMLGHLGVQIDKQIDRLIVQPTDLQGPCSISVPGDMSSAAFFLVGAAISGGAVEVRDVGINPTRAGILDILRSFGAQVEVVDPHERCGEPVATVRVEAGDRRPVEVSGALTVSAIDELPLVAVLGAFAEGDTVVTDAAELRVKESDRVATIAAGLGALGVEVEPTPDGFVVHGRGGYGMAGAQVDAHGDHRIAMSLAVAASTLPEGETLINGWSAVDVSYPGFGEDLDALGVP